MNKSKMSLVEQWEHLIEKRKEIEEHVNQGAAVEHLETRRTDSPTRPAKKDV